MKKIILIGLLILLGISFFVIRKSLKTLEEKSEIYSKLNTLPNPIFVDMDSSLYIIETSDKYTLLIYFDPDCIICEHEVMHFSNDDVSASFKNSKLVFFSSSDIEKIKIFSKKVNLANEENVTFVKIEPSQLYVNFGTVGTPHIFIYSSQNELMAQYKNQSSVSLAAKYLMNQRTNNNKFFN